VKRIDLSAAAARVPIRQSRIAMGEEYFMSTPFWTDGIRVNG
jgi:hypothetical protein